MRQPRDPLESGFFRRIAAFTKRSERQSSSIGHRLRTRLLVGFLIAFPLVVTAFFGRFVFGLLDKWFRPISEHYLGFPIPGIGMMLALLGMLALGMLATNVIGSRVLRLFEQRVSRLPLISPIYQGARQITEALQIRDASQFRKVVMLQFPHPGIRSIGFVTREFPGPTAFSEEDSALVFVPTTPNPTSGFLVSVKLSDLDQLDITVEAGVKLVISGGLLTPESLLGPGSAGSN